MDDQQRELLGMKKFENVAAPAQSWIKPELKRLNAGAAENGTTRRGDSGSTTPGTALS
jgi:hypothetical protein